MEASKKYNRQLEINDLIDDAISNAVTRRGLVETLSDDEAASVGGALRVAKEYPSIAGFKQIDPVCPPTKLPIKPICPQIVGLIALPLTDSQ